MHACVCVYINHLPLVNYLLGKQHIYSKKTNKNKTKKNPKSCKLKKICYLCLLYNFLSQNKRNNNRCRTRSIQQRL